MTGWQVDPFGQHALVGSNMQTRSGVLIEADDELRDLGAPRSARIRHQHQAIALDERVEVRGAAAVRDLYDLQAAEGVRKDAC